VDTGASAKLELVDKFCYLGDMLSEDGDADAAVEARIRVGVSSGTGLPGLSRTKAVKRLCVCVPLLSTLSFQSLSLLINTSSVSAITAKSSAYSSSHGRATLNSLDMASMTITNNSGLNAEPWCIPIFTSKPLLLP